MHTHPCDEHAIIIFNKEFCSKGNSKSRGMLEADRQGISWKTHYNIFIGYGGGTTVIIVRYTYIL